MDELRNRREPRATAVQDRQPSRQAERHAERARRQVAQRRAEQSGVTGWVADRASEWTLDGPDFDFLELQKYFWNPLMDYWFRMEMTGWDKLPDPPALLIGIHSGAPLPWDAWTVGIQWWRRHGRERPLHGTAHDALMAFPVLGAYFRKMGVLPAAPDSISSALASGRDVALWPGGDRDALRAWTRRRRKRKTGGDGEERKTEARSQTR